MVELSTAKATRVRSSSGRAFGRLRRRASMLRDGLRSPDRANPERGLVSERRPGAWMSRPFTGKRRKRARRNRRKGESPEAVTRRGVRGSVGSPVAREETLECEGGRLAEAGRPRVKRGGSPTGNEVSASGSEGNGTRRGCSSLTNEECGLHVPARRACSVAPRGLLRETHGVGGLVGGKRSTSLVRTIVELFGETGAGDAKEPRPGGIRS